ncbi:hypothetical protein KQI84_04500 [bacterium]|nr:hypothetical protein [bacterium]
MADESKKNNEEKTEEEPFQTYYEEDEGKTGFRVRMRPEEVKEAVQHICDSVLRTVPVDVTEHLANSQKEFLKAGVAFAESVMKRTDDRVKRAKDLHEKKD